MSAGARLLDLLYPNGVACWACGREAVLGEDCLCAECRGKLVLAQSDIPCPPGLDGLCAGLTYQETVEPAMYRFKYKRQVWLAPFLASYIRIPDEWRIDCLVPTPLHPLREWQRTYNQSELLARELHKRYPFPVRTDLIRRARYTRQQAKLTAAERTKNLAGAFMANTRAADLSIVLIDDVTTTHSTLLNCATALRHAGAKHVYAACACVAVLDRATT